MQHRRKGLTNTCLSSHRHLHVQEALCGQSALPNGRHLPVLCLSLLPRLGLGLLADAVGLLARRCGTLLLQAQELLRCSRVQREAPVGKKMTSDRVRLSTTEVGLNPQFSSKSCAYLSALPLLHLVPLLLLPLSIGFRLSFAVLQWGKGDK